MKRQLRQHANSKCKKQPFANGRLHWLNPLEQAVLAGNLQLIKPYLKHYPFRLLPTLDHHEALLSKWKLFHAVYHLTHKQQLMALQLILLNNKQLVFYCARLAIIKNESKTLHYLLQFNFDINITDDEGNSLLHLAVMQRRFELVDLLIAYGASTTLTNASGYLPLDLAILDKQKQIAILLLEYYTEPKAQTITLCLQTNWYRLLIKLLKLDSTLLPEATLQAVKLNKPQALFLIVNCFSIQPFINKIKAELNQFIQPQCYHILMTIASSDYK